ncbi:MAG: DUF2851 family protein [Salibacteraceae bacterium]
MTEDFLHYIWKYQLFNANNLITHSGQNLSIVSPGIHNHASGPDFSEAVISIGNISWAGNVEIHKNSSDWFRHKHEKDPNYLKVILHVVWNYDQPVYDLNKNEIPVLVLNGKVSNSLIKNYRTLNMSKNSVLCSELIDKRNDFKTSQWLHRVLIERLEYKVSEIKDIYLQTNRNWEQTMFVVLSKNFGFKVNAIPMHELAKRIDFKILLKNKDSQVALESIFFGVAGLIPDKPKSVFEKHLKTEFAHNKHKYQLETIDKSIWKFGKVRPTNFPTLRISQLATLILKNGNLFDVFVRNMDIETVKGLLSVKCSDFWDTHFIFERKSKDSKKNLGKKSIENILINSITPMLFFYGKESQSLLHQEMAISLLEKTHPENNFITKNWAQYNMFAKNAFDSQALIQLTNSYCNLKNCLNCGIGKQLLINETS